MVKKITTVKFSNKPCSDGVVAPSPIAKIIRQLMNEVGIKEAELARQTQLPQTTINRLLTGETIDPRANTLKPIAKFFCVTVDQLLVNAPIDSNRIPGTFRSFNRDAWKQVPIIEWDNALSWIFREQDYEIHSHEHWIATERLVSNKSFAMLSKPFMEPRFRKGSVLIIDPEAKYEDGKFVIICLDNLNVSARQLSYDNEQIYLKHFDKTIPTQKFENAKHRIVGVIVEARINL